ncbi:MAG: YciI-like protein [Lysobacterales bacterium]
MHYILIYQLSPDYLSRRAEFRSAHLKLAWAAQESQDLILGGALGDPADQAILLFQGDTPAAAERFARADPYVANGLVLSWSVRPWNTVVGDQASHPVRPEG